MDTVAGLVSAAQAGSTQAFSELYLRFQNAAYAAAYGRLQDHELAQDAAQEAFVEAFLNLAGLREPSAFAGWLRTIVLRQCIRAIRRKHVSLISLEEIVDLPSEEAGPEMVVMARDSRQRLLAAIRTLRHGEQSILELFYYRGYSCKEIAELLGIRLPAVKKRLFDARRSLRTRLLRAEAESWRDSELWCGGELRSNLEPTRRAA